jgi:hypothetical protein
VAEGKRTRSDSDFVFHPDGLLQALPRLILLAFPLP